MVLAFPFPPFAPSTSVPVRNVFNRGRKLPKIVVNFDGCYEGDLNIGQRLWSFVTKSQHDQVDATRYSKVAMEIT